MNAWESLISGSTLQSGTAWEHLQAQGGGSATYIVMADGLESSMATTEIEAEIGAAIEADIDQAGITADIDQSPREAEI